MQLALFDFDGTITTKDSLADFIQYAVGKPKYYLGLLKLSPTLLAYILKITPNYVAKEKMMSHFFKDWNNHVFAELADSYSLNKIDNITRFVAIQKLKWHQSQNHQVVIVSASIDYWMQKWCQKHNIELIATELEIQNGRLTGKFITKNCHGVEKVNRIKEKYDLSKYHVIYAYGDSKGDKDMLSLADKPYYKCFHDKND